MGLFSQSDTMGPGTPTLSLPRSLVALACPKFAPVQGQGDSAGRQRRWATLGQCLAMLTLH